MFGLSASHSIRYEVCTSSNESWEFRALVSQYIVSKAYVILTFGMFVFSEDPQHRFKFPYLVTTIKKMLFDHGIK